MSSANNDSFSSSFLIWRPLISCLIAVARTLNTMSNKHGEGGYPCLVPDCKEKAFSCLPLTVMLALGLSPVAFIMLEVHLLIYLAFSLHCKEVESGERCGNNNFKNCTKL